MDGALPTRRWKRHDAHEIITALQTAKAMSRAGFTTPEIASKIGVSVTTLFRWRSQYGGLRPKHIHHILELEAEVRRLRQIISELDDDLPAPRRVNTAV